MSGLTAPEGDQMNELVEVMAKATREFVTKRIAELEASIDAKIKDAASEVEARLAGQIPEVPDVAKLIGDAIAAIPAPEVIPPETPEPGEDGKDGKDALEIDIIPGIAKGRTYHRGTYAQHQGGVWKAMRETDHIEDDAARAGWACILQGVAAIEVYPLEDGVVAVKSRLSGGADHIAKIDLGGMYYKGVWQEGAYQKNAAVTWGGSTWIAAKATETKPGLDDSWTLAVKRGRDAKVSL